MRSECECNRCVVVYERFKLCIIDGLAVGVDDDSCSKCDLDVVGAALEKEVMGDRDGLLDGENEGLLLGIAEGLLLGVAGGLLLGADEGLLLGVDVGFNAGSFVDIFGEIVGCIVGSSVHVPYCMVPELYD